MRSNNPQYTGPAMQVIKHTDPNLYQRMMDCEWIVNIVNDPDDLRPILDNDGFMAYIAVVSGLSSAFAITIINPNGAADHIPHDMLNRTWIRSDAVDAGAEDVDVPHDQFLADVMVHEFKHHDGNNLESAAFDAGTEFARELGNAKLVKFSEDTRNSEVTADNS